MPREPACPACPLAALCQARRKGLERQLPAGRTRKPVPVRCQIALLAERDGCFLVRPRPAEGFLGGLWELPVADLCAGESALAAAGRLAAELGLNGRKAAAGQLKHAYSHFTLTLELVRVTVSPDARVAEGCWHWQTPAQLAATPLHGAHRKALALFVWPAAPEGRDE